MILYSAGYNELSSDLKEDIDQIAEGFLPTDMRNSNVVLVFAKHSVTDIDFSTLVEPVLIRLYRKPDGSTGRDTVKTWPSSCIAASPETLNEVLSYVKETWPAAGYGLLVSSHGTGWLPKGYYADPDKFEPDHGFDWERPARSILHEYEGGRYSSTEVELALFASAIPMKMEYIIMDACLMGGVEVAYELRDKCAYIAFSPTEIISDGMDYTVMGERLVSGRTPDVKGFCEDYFEMYNSGKMGLSRSATISLVDCSRLDGLAETCRYLFDKYRYSIACVNPDLVQQYGRIHNFIDHHWYYDLRDIVKESGASADDLALLDAALAECVVYKAATPSFLGMAINDYCGLSMYLPSNGSEYLDNWYRENVSWNAATRLVE